MLQRKYVKNSEELHSPSILKDQWCGNEILESKITTSLKRAQSTLSM